jgi:predicted aspartyl protease
MVYEKQVTKPMARFSVSVEVANNDDLAAVRRGALEPSKVRRLTIPGVVDTGASRLVLPKRVVDDLGLIITGQIKVKDADRRVAKRPVVEEVYIGLQGRHGVFRATVERKRETALIGAIVLEDLDFLVDPLKERLVPRDPKFIVAEIE